jgi:hypothetical protein
MSNVYSNALMMMAREVVRGWFWAFTYVGKKKNRDEQFPCQNSEYLKNILFIPSLVDATTSRLGLVFCVLYTLPLASIKPTYVVLLLSMT